MALIQYLAQRDMIFVQRLLKVLMALEEVVQILIQLYILYLGAVGVLILSPFLLRKGISYKSLSEAQVQAVELV